MNESAYSAVNPGAPKNSVSSSQPNAEPQADIEPEPQADIEPEPQADIEPDIKPEPEPSDEIKMLIDGIVERKFNAVKLKVKQTGKLDYQSVAGIVQTVATDIEGNLKLQSRKHRAIIILKLIQKVIHDPNLVQDDSRIRDIISSGMLLNIAMKVIKPGRDFEAEREYQRKKV